MVIDIKGGALFSITRTFMEIKVPYGVYYEIIALLFHILNAVLFQTFENRLLPENRYQR